MVTTVGTSNDLRTLLKNFIQLERDAIAAYDVTIDKLDNPAFKERIASFRADHERHLAELTDLAVAHDAPVPAEGDAKEMLTTGKVKIADLVAGDGAILQAMSSNESDTVTAYERGAGSDAVPEAARSVFVRALEDERRHKAWMEEAARAG